MTPDKVRKLFNADRGAGRPGVALPSTTYWWPVRVGASSIMIAPAWQYGAAMRAVAFGQAEWIEPLNNHRGQIDVAFRPNINEFNGMKRVELQLLDWRVAKIPVSPPHAPKSSEVEKANCVR